MSIDREGKPTAKETFEALVAQERFRNKSYFEKRRGQKTLEGRTIDEEWFEERVLFGFLNNFTQKLPSNDGKRKTRSLRSKSGSEISPEVGLQDINIAIDLSGVDKQALAKYLDDTGHYISEGSVKDVRELVLPVFIKLLEMGYTDTELGI